MTALFLSACGGGGGSGGDPVTPPGPVIPIDLSLSAYRGEPVTVNLSTAGVVDDTAITLADDGQVAFLDYDSGAGTCTLTPANGYVGSADFDLTITHNHGQQDTVTVSIDWAAQSSSELTLVTAAGCIIDPGGPLASLNDADISDDGRWVVFSGMVGNLVGLEGKGITASQVFLYDRQTSEQLVISTDGDGRFGDLDSLGAKISDDGRWIVYQTRATNLIGAASSNASQIMLYDRITGSNELLSRGTDDAPAVYTCHSPCISADGSVITYITRSSNIVSDAPSDLIIYDRSGPTPVVSAPITRHNPANAAFLNMYRQTLSPDGQLIALISTAGNLVANDTNNGYDLFIYDRSDASIERISLDESGNEVTGAAYLTPMFSADGDRLVFCTSATLVAADTYNSYDAYLYDRSDASLSVLSLATDGSVDTSGSSDGSYRTPIISADGSTVYFQARTLLAAGGTVATDGQALYAHDIATGTTTAVPISLPADPVSDYGTEIFPIALANQTGEFLQIASHQIVNPSFNNVFRSPQIVNPSSGAVSLAYALQGRIPTANGYVERGVLLSDDGRYAIYKTTNRNAEPTPTPDSTDQIMVFDHQTGTASAAFATIDGMPVNDTISADIDASGDGRYICFLSSATNLHATATTPATRIYRYDRQTATMSVLFEPSGSNVYRVFISDDATVVAFDSRDRLLPADTNNNSDIYCYDSNSDTLTLISRTATGNGGNASSYLRGLSADGNSICFDSTASDLAGGATSSKTNIYAYGRSSDSLTLVSRAHDDSELTTNSRVYQPSPNGRFIPFVSTAQNILASGGPTNAHNHCYIYDLQTDSYTWAGKTGAGLTPNSNIDMPAISDDGQTLIFKTYADNMVAGYTPPTRYWLYVRDLASDTTIPMPHDPRSVEPTLNYIRISGDGSTCSFACYRGDFLPVSEPGNNAYTIPTPTGGSN